MKHLRTGALLAALACTAAGPALAASHSWKINELFSNADGTIQFVEMYCPLGASNETFLGGKSVTSSANGTVYTFAANLPANSTSDKYLLLATQAFADLPGAPTPDHIIAANSFSIAGDTIQWHIYATSTMTMGAGDMPTDGINSYHRDTGAGPNTPTNFAGVGGTVDASHAGPGPAAVPDGAGDGNPMTVDALDDAGDDLRIAWDVATCSEGAQHQIVFGQRSDLPAAPGTSFALAGAVCGIGSSSPYDWVGAPATANGDDLVWWLVVVQDGGTEGSWGRAGGLERQGPGPDGSSAFCGATAKDVGNTCGH